MFAVKVVFVFQDFDEKSYLHFKCGRCSNAIGSDAVWFRMCLIITKGMTEKQQQLLLRKKKWIWVAASLIGRSGRG